MKPLKNPKTVEDAKEIIQSFIDKNQAYIDKTYKTIDDLSFEEEVGHRIRATLLKTIVNHKHMNTQLYTLLARMDGEYTDLEKMAHEYGGKSYKDIFGKDHHED